MNKYIIKSSTEEENEIIIDKLVEYNLSKVPLLQKEKFLYFNKVIKNEEDEIIAGIISRIYCWNCMYIDTLFVDTKYRNNGFGTKLIEEAEKNAKMNKCTLIHLDTFDFQAKDFYLKQGYEFFGVLEDCPKNHKRYYMKKIIK